MSKNVSFHGTINTQYVFIAATERDGSKQTARGFVRHKFNQSEKRWQIDAQDTKQLSIETEEFLLRDECLLVAWLTRDGTRGREDYEL